LPPCLARRRLQVVPFQANIRTLQTERQSTSQGRTHRQTPRHHVRVLALILRYSVAQHQAAVSAITVSAIWRVNSSSVAWTSKASSVSRLVSRPYLLNTEKLALPSISQVSQVHTRGPFDGSWYTPHYAPRPTVSSERLPALPQIQAQSTSSGSPSPRGGSFSASSVANGSASSNTSYSSSVNGAPASGFKTPSPEQTPQSLGRDGQLLNAQQESPYAQQHNNQGYSYANESYGNMNQMQQYTDVHQPHMSTPGHPVSGAPSAMGHYSQYQPQPPLLQPGPQSYQSAPPQYGQYYGNGVAPAPSANPVTTSMNQALVPHSLPPPPISGAPGATSIAGSAGQAPYHSSGHFDTTGQVAPPGMKPRVTATLWEDEGSLCFQVEAKGVCVARREDNHMINGTKLLNVAGMTRGRRDGILKSEKTRHVVKIGPMHLKGVWIPFERALDFANKEKITEQLYPLFVHDIGALLYHPSNQTRGSIGGAATMTAMDRRRAEGQRYLGAPQSSQAPALTHHHSMTNPVGGHIPQPPHSIAPHPASGRPGIDRAHTFPTPPTSASSMMGMGNSGSSYEWSGAAVPAMQNTQPLAIDTGLSNTRSVPTTPASTPPGSMQTMSQYPTSQGYDGNRQMYTAPSAQQGQYGSQPSNMVQYRQPLQPSAFPKNEMGPPARTGTETDQDSKPSDGMLGQGSDPVSQGPGEEEAEHEHDSEYTHSTAPYNQNRAPYGYSASASGPLHSDHTHLSPEMTGSPHQNGSGRATPRTTATAQAWTPQGYSTHQRQQAPASNLYSVMTDTRGTANGNSAADTYPTPNTLPAGYPPQGYSSSNGMAPSNKRGRDDDDEDPYRRDDLNGIKRQKSIREENVGGAVGGGVGDLQRTRAPISQRRR